MIKTGNIHQINHSCNENWLIVRSPGEMPENVKHIPALAPSPDLFKKYRAAFHSGCFNKAFFDEIYVPQFLRELSKNAKALALLRELKEHSLKRDYFLCCFCEDEALCHRSIIAGILLGMGSEIETSAEYIQYYKMFVTELKS